MNNSTARETLLLSVREKKEDKALQATQRTKLMMIIITSWFAAVLHSKIPGVCVWCVCFCPSVQPILPFVCQERHYIGSNDLTRLISHLYAHFSPSALLAATSQLIYSCTQLQCFLQHTMSTDALVAGTMHITEDNCLCIFPHVRSLPLPD